MRLLNVDTWKLESYPTADTAPPYVILSHRWQDDEITFEDFVEHPLSDENRKLTRRVQRLERLVLALATDNSQSTMKQSDASWKSSAPAKDLEEEEPEPAILDDFPHLLQVCRRKAWLKLKGLAAVALQLGLSHVWVDTFCIDQKSSSELSESINSMFLWYTMARICVAYLYDVYTDAFHAAPCSFTYSEWFLRGWTLQELIAPQELWFFDAEWAFLATRKDSALDIYHKTKIPVQVFAGEGAGDLQNFSVAARLSWAADRVTSRPEDRAYSLMGLFGVNIPTIYGEGESRAFFRLQTEIFQAVRDNSIFCWGTFPYAIGYEKPYLESKFVRPSSDVPRREGLGLFASTVQDFSQCGDIEVEDHNLNDFALQQHETGLYNAHVHRARVQLLARLYEPQYFHRRLRACLFCKRREDKHNQEENKLCYIVVDIGTDGSGEFFRDSTFLWFEQLIDTPASKWRVTDFYIPYLNSHSSNQTSLANSWRWNSATGQPWTFTIDYSAIGADPTAFLVRASERSQSRYNIKVKQDEQQILYSMPYRERVFTVDHSISIGYLRGNPFLDMTLEMTVTYESIKILVGGKLRDQKKHKLHAISPTVLRLSGQYTAPVSSIFVARAEGRLFHLLVKDQNARPAKLILGVY